MKSIKEDIIETKGKSKIFVKLIDFFACVTDCKKENYMVIEG
jgi:hypothetical protein